MLDLSQDIYDENKKIEFKHIRSGKEKTDLSSIHSYKLLADSFGNLWIGYEGDGVDCITHYSSYFKTISTKERGKMAISFCADNGKKVWIGNDAGSITILNDEAKEKKIKSKLPDGFDDAIVQTLYKDKDGKIWIGTFLHGIIVYDPETEKLSSLDPDPSIPLHIKCFAEGQNDIMWIGTHHGVFKYDMKTKQFTHDKLLNNAIDDNIIMDIKCDLNGNIWIATFSSGLSCFDKNEKLLWRSLQNNKFPSTCVNTLFINTDEEILAGTRKGLVTFINRYFDTPDFDNFIVRGEESGLANGNIRALNEDIFGNIWMSTNIGISAYIPNRNSFTNYYWYDGIHRGQYIDGSTTIDDQGMIYFGSREGIVYFNPIKFRKTEAKSSISISDFIVYRKRNDDYERNIYIHNNASVNLDYDENSIQINYSCKDISYSSAIEYEYQLQGLDNIWYKTTENNVTYRNLPSGKYNFLLRHRLRGDDWDDKLLTLDIIVGRPWWFSAYAITVYSMVCLALLYLLFYLYHRRVKAENRLIIETENHNKDKKINSERLEFFTNIAHELRTPLTLIMGPVEDILEEISDKKMKDRLTVVNRNAKRLHELINRIMEFRKTETCNRRLNLIYGDPFSIISEVVLQFKANNNNELLKIECNLEKDIELWYDKDVISIVLNNIISNALKYTIKGSISIESGMVIREEKKYYFLRISDTGCGIAKDNLPYIFNSYYQGNGQFQAEGTGIGLALVKNLVELHNAQISVESNIGEGTIFEILFDSEYEYMGESRLESVNKREKLQPNIGINLKEGEDDSTIKILLVEDNKDIQDYFVSALSDIYSVMRASDGKEGLNIAFESIPDIIISDIMMPNMDGMELCRIIKSDLRTSHIPVVLLTAKDSADDKLEGYKNGADSYLTKPVNSNLLKARIENILNRRKLFIELITNSVSSSLKSDKLINAYKEQSQDTELNNEVKNDSISQLNDLDRAFLERLDMTIDLKMGNSDIDVSELASEMNMSHSSLYRKIKALAGCTVSEFIQNRRMLKASELLKKSDMTIQEVMYSVGMNTPAYFRKCFKDKFGCLPSEYR